MNRKARRAAGEPKAKKVATYNYTEEQIAELVRHAATAAYNEAVDVTRASVMNYTIDMCHSGMIMKLHDRYGFGMGRIKTLMEEVSNTYDAIESGYVELDEIRAWCREFGVVFQELKTKPQQPEPTPEPQGGEAECV